MDFTAENAELAEGVFRGSFKKKVKSLSAVSAISAVKKV